MEHLSFYKQALGYADPRTKDWFLIWGDPIPTITLTIIYLLIVIIGQRYMQHRKAICIPPIILFSYNMGLVILSVYLVEEVKQSIYFSRN